MFEKCLIMHFSPAVTVHIFLSAITKTVLCQLDKTPRYTAIFEKAYNYALPFGCNGPHISFGYYYDSIKPTSQESVRWNAMFETNA